jgi:SOS-response transcriptional repressor LexA
MQLSPRLQQALDFIQATQAATGQGPTVRALAKHMGAKSSSTGTYYLRKLAEKKPSSARGLRRAAFG